MTTLPIKPGATLIDVKTGQLYTLLRRLKHAYEVRTTDGTVKEVWSWDVKPFVVR